MASLGVLTLGGIAAALNMRRTSAQRAAARQGYERGRDTMLDTYWPWDLSAAGSGLGLLGKAARDSAVAALVLRASAPGTTPAKTRRSQHCGESFLNGPQCEGLPKKLWQYIYASRF